MILPTYGSVKFNYLQLELKPSQVAQTIKVLKVLKSWGYNLDFWKLGLIFIQVLIVDKQILPNYALTYALIIYSADWENVWEPNVKPPQFS